MGSARDDTCGETITAKISKVEIWRQNLVRRCSQSFDLLVLTIGHLPLKESSVAEQHRTVRENRRIDER